MSHCALRLLILLWSPGEGSESKTCPEFLSSQISNPTSDVFCAVLVHIW
jgi:hypothetical protein